MEQAYQRKRCPFYGFHQSPGLFMDSRGNQCALITDSYSPCRMEVVGDPVDWDECPITTEDDKATIAASVRGKMFPEEIPNGISELEWFAQILKLPKPQRPS